MFELEPFRPALTNPHAQTILSNNLRGEGGILFRRERLTTPDGDFVDLDYADVPGLSLSPDAPLVLVLHGAEGSARRGYMCQVYRQLARQGVRSVGLNFRSCSGELNRTHRTYHMGFTDDVRFVIDTLDRRQPQVTKGLVGFSLGANILLKYLGEGHTGSLQAAVAISPPFDLGAMADRFEYTRIGQLYMRYFMHGLMDKFEQSVHRLPPHLDPERIRRAATLREFDQACTVPLYGFPNTQTYYETSSARHTLSSIRVPTLILRAVDDPVFANDIPHDDIAASPYLYDGITAHGGHVGFVENTPLPRFWAERQTGRFMRAMLAPAAQAAALSPVYA